jgi:hypothetical protein
MEKIAAGKMGEALALGGSSSGHGACCNAAAEDMQKQWQRHSQRKEIEVKK